MSPSATPATKFQTQSPGAKAHDARAPIAAPATQFQAERPGAHTAPNDARAYIRPLVEPEVPRLPRKMQAARPGAHTARNDARTTPGRTSAAPATQNASRKARSPHCTKRRLRDDARAYIRPLERRQVPRLPRKMQAERPGAHTTPNDARTTPGRTSAAPATQNASRKARSPHCTKRRQDDARAYIRPLGRRQVPRLPRKMQAERPGAHTAPNDARTTPGRRQGVHQTPCRARSAALATQNASRKARSPHCTKRRQDDARAYIRPLGRRQVPRLPRKMQAERPGAHTAPNDARTTPGRTSDPL